MREYAVVRDRVRVEDLVSNLEALDLDGLRVVWSNRFGPPPKLRSVELLRLILAWRLQAKTHGGLDAATRRQLERRGSVMREGRQLGLGAVLRRSWEGRLIEVIVEADGFRFDGHLHASLSAIAQAVTGTRWNGPRFFGLRKEKAPGGRVARGRRHQVEAHGMTGDTT
jgi:Protein of unknown function (DUF2924)